MRFTSVIVLTALALVCILTGCTVEPTVNLSAKGSVNQENMNINPKSVVGYVGDPMPFFDNGEMNVFYLQDGRNTYLGFHPFALMTTSDLVNYKDYGEVIPYVNSIYSEDLALGTGSVIKDKNGLYHCFYTGFNDRPAGGFPFKEKIQHAVSPDKINWTKKPEDGFYGGANDFRDPYVYYEEADDTYYMLITTRVNNHGVIKQYKSKDLTKWTDNGVFFKNDAGSYNMECPTYLYYNGYYYLSYSEQGSHRVTHYRYKKNLSDPWIKPEVDYFDGEGLYAGRMEKGFGSLYIFGWCGTKTGDFDQAGFDWGGSLVTLELIQQEDGTLKPSLPKQYKYTFKTQVSYKTVSGKFMDEFSFNQGEQKAIAMEALSDNITRINFKLSTKSLTSECGLSFNSRVDDILGSLNISFNFKNNKISFYNNVYSFDDYGSPQITVPFEFALNEMVDVDVIIDGEIITVCANGEIALTTRMIDMVGQNFSFYSNGCAAKFSEVKFYE